MSPGARDLIPRMLIVDPMKRITIPDIRQHPWFQAHLPRYLAVPPPDTMQQAKKVDSVVLLSLPTACVQAVYWFIEMDCLQLYKYAKGECLFYLF